MSATQLEIEGLHPKVPRPVGWRILIKPLEIEEETTEGGLVLPSSVVEAKEFMQFVGKVVAVGPDAYSGTRFTSGPWAKPGDFVVYNPYNGQNIEVKHDVQSQEVEKFRLINDDEVRAVAPEPKALKVYCN